MEAYGGIGLGILSEMELTAPIGKMSICLCRSLLAIKQEITVNAMKSAYWVWLTSLFVQLRSVLNEDVNPPLGFGWDFGYARKQHEENARFQ